MLTSVFGVVVLLGGLIFFHELGHYLVAKFFKIRVEVFSLGFGKKIFSKRVGETEYCLSIVPLGGYVKLMGDDPYKGIPAEDAARAFSTQKLYKRFAVVAAGPIANLLLAYVLFSFVFYQGQKTVAARVGGVVVGSPAWSAGLRPGDRILGVAGQPVGYWSQMEEALRPKEGQKVEIEIDRAGNSLRIPTEISKIQSRSIYGEEEWVGGLKGVSPMALAPAVGVSNPKSAAYLAGLRTGDYLVKVEATPVTTYEDIGDALSREWADGKAVTFTFKRDADKPQMGPEQSLTVTLPKKPASLSPFGLPEALGLYPTDVFVREISPGTPADKGGLLAGDRIAKVGEESIYGFDSIVDKVQDYGTAGKPIVLTVERNGEVKNLDLKPIETVQVDPMTHQTYKKFMIGFAPRMMVKEPEYTKIQVRGFPDTLLKGISETNTWAKRMVISMGKLVMGQISVKNLGGPVLIAEMAGKSLDQGWTEFFQMMALISINLFLLNLFPVPVLDGGHLLFFIMEAFKGKPVSVKTMEIANQIGMVFILVLVVLTLFNDISRLIN